MKNLENWKIDVSMKIEQMLMGDDSVEEFLLKEILRLLDCIDNPEILAELEYYARLISKVKQTNDTLRQEYMKIEGQIRAVQELLRAINQYLDILNTRKKVLNEIRELNEEIIKEVEDKLMGLRYA